jgi:hypothetical protein
MNKTTKLLLALSQIEGVAKLMKDNEWESFFIKHLTPIQVELNRQLSLETPHKPSTDP